MPGERQTSFQEEFSPQQELKAIFQAPSSERKNLLNNFKKRLLAHREGMAEVQITMIEIARSEIGLPIQELRSAQDLYQTAIELGKKYGMNEEERELARQFIQRYTERRDYLKSLRQQFPDDVKLFEEIFGFSPKGKIELIETPWSFYFRCYDQDDFALVIKCKSSQGANNQQQTFEHQLKAATTLGITLTSSSLPKPLRGAIIAENSSLCLSACPDEPEKAKEMMEETFWHEQQHALYLIFNPSNQFEKNEQVSDFNLIENIIKEITLIVPTPTKEQSDVNFQKVEKALKAYLNAKKEEIEEKIKNEILAFFSEISQENLPETTDLFLDRIKKEYLLREGGSYDFFSPTEEFLIQWLRLIQQKVKETSGVFVFKLKPESKNEDYLERWPEIIEEFNRNLAQEFEKAKNEIKEEYKKDVENALETLKNLTKLGYSKNQIVALLTHEPILRWPKLAQRLLETKVTS